MEENKLVPLEQPVEEDFSIVVDDGSRRVPIRNKEGEEIGVFYFRPTDLGIVDRFNAAIEKLDDIMKPVENAPVREDGSPDDPDDMEAFKEAERRLYEICDYIFDGNMSAAFFGKMAPFSPVNGAFYCENAIEAVGNFISGQFDEETRKLTKRMAKYTEGYTPGQRRRQRKK